MMSKVRFFAFALVIVGVVCGDIRETLDVQSTDAESSPFLVYVITWLLGWIWAFTSLVLKLALMLVLAALFGVWWCQGLLLYLPNSASGGDPKKRGTAFNVAGYRTPMDHGIPYEDLYLRTNDKVRVHAWFLKQKEKLSQAPTIIFFHGNAGNIGYRLPLMKTLYDVVGCNILALQYRGYGNSEGTPSERGLTLDAQAAVDFLLKQSDIDRTKIFVYGQSLGGAVAIKTAFNNQSTIAGVIVENTFTSIDDMVVEIGVNQLNWKVLSYLRPFLAVFITSNWYSIRRVPELKMPTLFLSGLNDELIPPIQMRTLYDAATSSRHRVLKTFNNGSHNDTHVRGGMAYYKAIYDLIHESVGEPPVPPPLNSNPRTSSTSL